MKRILIGALVGALLIFAWQAVSRMFLKYHYEGLKQAPNSELILSALSSNIKEDGQYYLPDLNPNATPEQMQEMEKNMQGKPWAIINYHASYKPDMTTPMIRQFGAMFLAVALFIWILGKNAGSYSTVLFKSIAAGFLVFVAAWYPQNIWWQVPWPVIQAEMFDLLAGWALAGLWLGWWLNRRRTSR